MTDEFFANELDEIAHDLTRPLDRINRLLDEHVPGDAMLVENRRLLDMVQRAASWQAEYTRARQEAA